MIDLIRRRQAAPMSSMARLSTRLTPTLSFFMPRGRCSPASPSEEGGFDEVTEFCSRTANFSLKIRYLLLRFEDLLLRFQQLPVALDQFLPQSLVLTAQSFDITLQLLRFRSQRFHPVR